MRTAFALALLATPTLSLAPVAAQVSLDNPCTWVSTIDSGGPMAGKGAIGGLAVDEQGRLYVATFRNEVYRVETNGTTTLLSNQFVSASGCALDGNGDLLQADFTTHQVWRIHEDGSRTLMAGGFTRPVGVAVAPDGDVYALNYGNDTIFRIDTAGFVSLFSDSPLLNGPNGLAINESGEMFVVNFKDNRVLRMNADGSASVLAAGPGQNAHIAIVRDKLYVSSIFRHVVYEVSMDGTSKIVAGLNGVMGMQNGCMPDARLSFPNGMARSVDGSILYTNNFVGIMGGPRGQIWVRTIRLE